ncbi:regulator of chromosome condensation 1/beta-lactamase-inhibitor protein II [Lipomyces kononenkoae]|uniref:Regulator of chromosome condensation 1/beta-lactamase-inhibitor protein II n=1 Tax=Lipomyces kononenkoae TaxID=34357 RepID=A0ACC3SUT8_LIPKO
MNSIASLCRAPAMSRNSTAVFTMQFVRGVVRDRRGIARTVDVINGRRGLRTIARADYSRFAKNVAVGVVAVTSATAITGYFLTGQHVTAQQAEDNTGVYAWGGNSKHVVGPGLKDTVIKKPRKIPYFDDMELRDLVLGDSFGVAVTARGDLLAWGDGYDPAAALPELILSGKNIRSVQISQGRIYALTNKGDKIYSIPGSKREMQQHVAETAHNKPWYLSIFTSYGNAAAFNTINVPLGAFESLKQIAAGDHHLVILTSGGKVYTCITGRDPVYSTEGQLGVPILPEDGEAPSIAPEGVHEVETLRGVNIVQIAAGQSHSVVRDDRGRAWSFGSNSHGQLGLDYTIDTAFIPIPSVVALDKLYNVKGNADVFCEYIAAGGNNTVFSVRNRKRDLADLWISGAGLHGQLGTGRYLHMQGVPSRMRPLSGILEYSETDKKHKEIPIRYVSIGKRHLAAVLDNATGTDSKVQRELFIWGANDFFQLGNGKRSNLPKPDYMNPLLSAHEKKPKKQAATGGEDIVEDVNERQHLGAGKSKKGRHVEETIVCGDYGSAVYWKC